MSQNLLYSTQPFCLTGADDEHSEEGLEQAFNSLDAQREACTDFILSQKHEGWTVLPTLYDEQPRWALLAKSYFGCPDAGSHQAIAPQE